MNSNRSTQKIVESILPCTLSDGQKAVRWTTKQSIEVQIHLMGEITALYLKLKKRYKEIDKKILSYCAEITVKYKTNQLFKKLHRKNSELISAKDLAMINIMNASSAISKQSRRAKKYEYLKRKEEQIIDLAKYFSLREIADQLKTADGETISHEYLRRFLDDVQERRKAL